MWNDPYVVHNRGEWNGHIPHLSTHKPDDDPLKEIYERVEHMYNYRQEEQGMFHPLEHQTLKMRNNGNAELFVDQDNGFRISKKAQTIHAFANHYKAHLHSLTEWLTGSEKKYIDKHYYQKTGGKTIFVSKDRIEVTGEDHMFVTIDKDKNVRIGGDMNVTIEGNANVNVEGNLNANVRQRATIDVDDDFILNSKGTIRMTAKDDFYIDGRKIYWG